MHQYGIYLAAHDYSIEERKTMKHSNAAGLSRQPLDEDGNVESWFDYVDIFHTEHYEPLPATCTLVILLTSNDHVLRQVYVCSKWSS